MSRAPAFSIRPVQKQDNPSLARIIRAVMTSFGACGQGFAISDPEVDFISEAYSRPRHAYFVISLGNELKGGAGLGPLAGGPQNTCELRKMYLLPETRGLGAGRALLQTCLDAARSIGFSQCYLETLNSMGQARKLYEKNGFTLLEQPMGNTGHSGCDRWYVKDLARERA